MRPDRPVDDQPITPAREDGAVRMYSLAFVCALGLIAGAAGALALHYARQGPAEVQGVSDKSEDVGRESGAEAGAVESRAAEGARTEDGETWGTGGEAGDEAEERIAASAGKARRPVTGVRFRAEAGGPAGDGSRAARRHAGASGGGGGGRTVAGHALGGVKKTGEGVKKTGAVIGKTFGRIGGVFHE